VTLDTANRNFTTLLGVSLLAGMFIFCGAVACVLVALVAVRFGQDGFGALTSGGESLWPAAAFIALVGSGAVLGIASVAGQARASRRLAGRVRRLALPLPSALAEAARLAGLGGRVALVDSPERVSFAYGALTPRVAVSRGLFEAASPTELAAVLAHERYHVRNLDPLKVLLARALPAAFFYLPVFRSLHARYVAGRELAADRRAVEICGRAPLAGALLKVVRGPDWPELRAAAAIGGAELLGARVAQLETGSEPPVPALTSALAASVAAGFLLVALFVASVASFGGPSAVTRTTGASLAPLDLASAVLCAAPFAAGLWLGYRWLARRTRIPLDTTKL
jgi:Zn-dependent protease with chaperone function